MPGGGRAQGRGWGSPVWRGAQPAGPKGGLSPGPQQHKRAFCPFFGVMLEGMELKEGLTGLLPWDAPPCTHQRFAHL